ncbi:MAG TPA: hypothetical protein VGR84_06445 [Candidatus Acidoferrales bacterium]|nr:hypothetical protein [Candidatus Acidoferrales bacterium]
MTGRRYYLTTIEAWRRHAGRCAETHFVAVNGPGVQNGDGGIGPQSEEATADGNGVPVEKRQAKACPADGERRRAEARRGEQACGAYGATQILALIDADEGAHLAMENDAEFETLPHPLARMPVSQRVSAALAQFGVAHGDDTFTVAEKLARVNPLLRHRVF